MKELPTPAIFEIQEPETGYWIKLTDIARLTTEIVQLSLFGDKLLRTVFGETDKQYRTRVHQFGIETMKQPLRGSIRLVAASKGWFGVSRQSVWWQDGKWMK